MNKSKFSSIVQPYLLWRCPVLHMSQADNLNSELGLSFSWNVSERNRM